MLIKIINGTYGYKAPGSKHIDPKSAGDPPFEVDDAKAKRLVDLGVAVYITDKPAKAVATSDKGENKADQGENTSEGKSGEKGTEKPTYSSKMKVDELKELIKNAGLSYKVGMSKDTMVAALDKFYKGENTSEGKSGGVDDTDDEDGADDNVDDDETPPSLSAELPVT